MADAIIGKVILAVSVVFPAWAVVYVLIRLFGAKPASVINNEGITDNSSAVSAGLVKWEDITYIRMKETFGQKILIIGVKNVEEVPAKQPLPKRIVMKLNGKIYSSPVLIASTALKCDFEELYGILRRQLAPFLNQVQDKASYGGERVSKHSAVTIIVHTELVW